MWDIVWVSHRLGLTTGAQIRVCKAPSLSTGAAVILTGMETVQERPLLSWKGETRLPDCGSSTRWALTTGADFWDSLNWLLMSVGITAHQRGFLDMRHTQTPDADVVGWGYTEPSSHAYIYLLIYLLTYWQLTRGLCVGIKQSSWVDSSKPRDILLTVSNKDGTIFYFSFFCVLLYDIHFHNNTNLG